MRLTLAVSLLASLAALPLSARAAEKPYRITYIQGVTGNPFYMSVACGGAEAAKRLGVTFEAQGPQQYTPALQMRVLNAVIAAQPDGILFTADDPVALTATLLDAKERGIKILSIDGDVKDMSVAVSNIQSDNFDGGGQAAKKLAELIGDKGEVMAMNELARCERCPATPTGIPGGDCQAPGDHVPGRAIQQQPNGKGGVHRHFHRCGASRTGRSVHNHHQQHRRRCDRRARGSARG